MAMLRQDWAAYRKDRLEKTLRAMAPEIHRLDDLILEEIEIAEVNEIYQRFRDFRHELAKIADRHGLAMGRVG